MSKKAALLTTEDVPEYIKEIVKRLSPVLVDYTDEEGNWWGYTFRLNAKWKCGYENQLINDTEKLVKWCRNWYAHSEIVRYNWWYEEFDDEYMLYKGRRRKAWKEGFRNNVILVISDPVAYRFEKDGFYKDKG